MHTMTRLGLVSLIAISLTLPAGCSPPKSPQADPDSIPMTDLAPAVNTAAEKPDYSFNGDFILPKSNTLKIDDETLYAVSPEHLQIARNEILARHGYVFKNAELQSYFSKKAWYEAEPGFTYDALNPIEKYNMAFLKYYESMGDEDTAPPMKPTGISVFPPEKEVRTDLNGDGRPETILWSREDSHSILKINDVVFEEDGDYFADNFGISDIDVSDSRKEVVISDLGPSDDYVSTFYSFDNNRITRMGQVGGLVDYGIFLDGSGRFSAQTRGSILQTWFFEKQYELTPVHQIKELKEDTYQTDCTIFVKRPVQVFSERSLSKPSFTLSEGTIITIIGTDNHAWCEIRTASGRQGWFAVKDFSTLTHEDMPVQDAFFGLSSAD